MRPTIVKFVRYNDRNNVFNRKKKLKGKNIAITESLTASRMSDSDGKILFKDGSGNTYLVINLDLVGNGKGLRYGKKKTFYYWTPGFGRKGPMN